MRLAIISALLCSASLVGSVSYPLPQSTKPHEEGGMGVEGVRTQELLGSGSLSAIPKTWRLIGVSSGEKPNVSNLWFQAEDGSVYLLQGGISQNRFVFHDQVYKIPAK
jgi:hypothetical protein